MIGYLYERNRANLLRNWKSILCIRAWYPKVRRVGILAGHDYMDGTNEHGTVFGVKSAVDEFAALHEAALSVSGEASYPSWYFLKLSGDGGAPDA